MITMRPGFFQLHIGPLKYSRVGDTLHKLTIFGRIIFRKTGPNVREETQHADQK